MSLLSLARRFGALASASVLFSLAACSAHDSAAVTTSSSGTTDTIAVSPTVSVAAVVGGGRQTVSLSFDSTGTTTLTDLTVTSGLSSLPAGWSGPSSFTCATVSTGNGCLLSLAYAPTAIASGTVTLAYSYKDSAGVTQTGTVTVNYTATTNDNVIGTASPAGQIATTLGNGSQAVSVTFTTDDGNPATALTLTTDLSSLPAGWTSTAKSFSCASISTGNGCQLPLTYAPSAVAGGTLALHYTYKDNSGDSKTGTVSIPYVTTANDNVVGTVAPSGQVVSILGSGAQAVTVTFTTDDGNPATALTLTSSLSGLPTGWSSRVSSLSCASVSTGNGCQLPLSFTPTTVGSGTVTLTYSYTDNAGTAKTGTVSIPYAGTVHDNVVGTASPSGQITAVVASGTQTVLVTFDTDDGNLASALTLTSNLNTLPSGWTSSAHTFTCAHVSSGSTCQLTLAYAPTAVATGTLSLGFSYTDNAGTAKTGTVSIPYAGTVHDTVVGTASPSGQISGAIGDAAHAVSVTFTTDDGNTATALSITSASLSALPLGWSTSAQSLACATVSTGTACQLSLAFTPTATATGTLALSYAYTDNAGTAKTGTVNIAYVSTSHNTVLGTQAPGGTIRVKVGDNKQIQVIFTTNDGNTATNFSITSDLTSLPAGWSGTNGFTCSAVNSGAGCSLPMTYAPTTNATGTITLNFSYTDSAFTAKTGTTTLSYSNPHLYALGTTTNICSIIAGGILSTCPLTATSADTSFAFGTGVFSGAYAYLAGTEPNFYTCSFENDGTLDACTALSLESGHPIYGMGAYGNYLYIGYDDNIYVCTMGVAGSLSNCTVNAAASALTVYGVAVTAGFAYVPNYSTPYMCAVSATDGTLSNCTTVTNSAVSGAAQMKIFGSYLYAAVNGGITSCLIAGDGTLGNCASYAVGGYTYDIAILDTDAYVTTDQNIYHCTVNQATGTLSACTLTNGDLSIGYGGLIIQ